MISQVNVVIGQVNDVIGQVNNVIGQVNDVIGQDKFVIGLVSPSGVNIDLTLSPQYYEGMTG